nr:MAG TPA: transcriptional regulator NrdR [Caudoviricetes sp.]
MGGFGVFCPYCGNEKTRVGATVKGLETVRFRKCAKCGRTWTTIETIKPNDEYLQKFIEARDEHRNQRA